MRKVSVSDQFPALPLLPAPQLHGPLLAGPVDDGAVQEGGDGVDLLVLLTAAVSVGPGEVQALLPELGIERVVLRDWNSEATGQVSD